MRASAGSVIVNHVVSAPAATTATGWADEGADGPLWALSMFRWVMHRWRMHLGVHLEVGSRWI